MLLDVRTLLVMTAINLLMVSLALPVLMGPGVSRAARFAQGSMLAQMLAWVLIIAAASGFDRALSTASIACTSLSQWMMFRALAGWLGRRPGERLLLALAVLTPLGYGLGFDSYPFRVGWSNFLLGAQILIVARATMFPRRFAGRRWRWLLCSCLLMMAFFTLARGTLGAFFTELYPSFRAPHPVNLGALLALNVTVVLGTVATLVAWREEVEERLRNMAMMDVLTNLLNRRGFTARAEKTLAQARRHGFPLVVLLLDLDFFKQVNDTHGHEVGDRALQLFARLLAENQRAGDLVGRLGGEEFGALLSHANLAAAEVFDHRLRDKLQQAAQSELGFPLNFSAGLAIVGPEETDLAALLARADTALYQAKAQGRGRLVAE